MEAERDKPSAIVTPSHGSSAREKLEEALRSTPQDIERQTAVIRDAVSEIIAGDGDEAADGAQYLARAAAHEPLRSERQEMPAFFQQRPYGELRSRRAPAADAGRDSLLEAGPAEGVEALQEIKKLVLQIVGADALDSPDAHLAYVRARLKSVA
jgi:hypothetical protein